MYITKGMKTSGFVGIVLGLIVTSVLGFSQTGGRLNRAQLLEDARQLVDVIEATHPDPYINGGGKIAFHLRFQKILRSIPDSGMNASAFLDLLQPLVMSIHDGHTAIYLDQSAQEEKPLLVPLEFKIVENAIYVSGVFSNYHRSMLGSRIESVEGIPFHDLVNRQLNVSVSENECHNLNNLTRSLKDAMKLRKLIPEIKDLREITFRFMSPEGISLEMRLLTVPDLPRNAIAPPSRINLPDISKKDPSYSFLDKEKEIALFRFGNLSRYREAFESRTKRGNEDDIDWARYIYKRYNGTEAPKDIDSLIAGTPSMVETCKSLFREMKLAKTVTLVLDVRDNSGGNAISADILVYFLFGWKTCDRINSDEKSIVRISELGLATNKRSLVELNSNRRVPLQVGDYDFDDFMGIDSGQESSAKVLSPAKRYEEYLQRSATFAAEVKEGEYEGYYAPKNVFVITSAGTFSSAYWLAADLQKAGAVLVGTPSGQTGNSFGDILFFKLKHSGIQGTVSYKRFLIFPNDEEKGKLLRPDIVLTYEKLKDLQFDPNAEILIAVDNVSEKIK
jgi:hypothetical protein